VAFPSNAVLGDDIFFEATDLLLLFGSLLEIISELKHRFDELPVHSLVYFQSYHQGALQHLITSGNELDQTGNQQDCLGNTPLHILACSSVHYLELYRVIGLQCRISCGADLVIYNVWPYLLPPNFVHSYVYVRNEEDSDSSNIDEDDDDELNNNSSNSDDDDTNNDDGWEG
jgi:hypothetical protein